MPRLAKIVAGLLFALSGWLFWKSVVGRPAPRPAREAAPVAAEMASAVAPEAPAPVELTPMQELLERCAQDMARLQAESPEQRQQDIERWAVIGVPRYGQLERGANAHFGARVLYRGWVEEIHDNDQGGSRLRVAMRRGGRDVLWVETLGLAPEWVERGSRVLVAGYVVGDLTYQSQAGWQITLPAILSVGIVRWR